MQSKAKQAKRTNQSCQCKRPNDKPQQEANETENDERNVKIECTNKRLKSQISQWETIVRRQWQRRGANSIWFLCWICASRVDLTIYLDKTKLLCSMRGENVCVNVRTEAFRNLSDFDCPRVTTLSPLFSPRTKIIAFCAACFSMRAKHRQRRPRKGKRLFRADSLALIKS